MSFEFVECNPCGCLFTRQSYQPNFEIFDQQLGTIISAHGCWMHYEEYGPPFKKGTNQAMRFGDLSSWANELSTSDREVVQYSDYDPESVDTNTCEMDQEECIFPSELLRRETL